MAKSFSKSNRNSRVKRFLFFLLLAAIFWMLTKFSREFTATMKAKINYVNIPETAALAGNNIHELTFDLSANGFEILFYKLKKPTLTIPVGKYYSKENDGFTIPKGELLRMIGSIFSRNLNVKNLSVDALSVRLDPIVLKKVAVWPITEISYKDGFKPVDSVRVNPDSIVISGPSGSVAKIDVVKTEPVVLKDVEQNVRETASIRSPGDEIVAIRPKKVEIAIDVAEFSQGKVTLPVEVINLPPNLDIKLVPQTITIIFDASVNDFSEIGKENFRVVCDFSKRNKEENFLIPKLEKKPKNIRNVVFEPKKIDFFIFK